MPSKAFQISAPVLLSGQYFDVSYRLLPSGTWVNTTINDNNSHMLVGLTEGNYEMTIQLVAGTLTCSLKKYNFVVRRGCNCDTDIEVYCERKNGVLTIAILSVPGATPPTMYRITITDDTGVQLISLNALSLNATKFGIPDNGATGFTVKIESYCNGNMDKTNECYYDVLLCLEQPPGHLVVEASKLIIDEGKYYIQILTGVPAESVYFGYKSAVDVLTESEIEGGNKQDYLGPAEDIEVTFDNIEPMYQWIAWPASDEGMTGYYIDAYNHDSFGSGTTFATPVLVGGYYFTQTNFKTTLSTIKLVH